MLNETFSGGSVPAGWTPTVTGDGTVTVGGGTATIDVAATGTARLLSPVDALTADGQSQPFLISSSSSFNGIIVLRQSGGSTDFNAAIQSAGGNWTPSRYRDSSGAGSLPSGATNFAKATPQWIRFVRASSTTFTIESAPDSGGTPGTWTVRATTDGGDALVIDMAATKLEFIVEGGGGTLVIDRAGDGSGGGGGGSVAAVIRRRRMMV